MSDRERRRVVRRRFTLPRFSGVRPEPRRPGLIAAMALERGGRGSGRRARVPRLASAMRSKPSGEFRSRGATTCDSAFMAAATKDEHAVANSYWRSISPRTGPVALGKQRHYDVHSALSPFRRRISTKRLAMRRILAPIEWIS
jgi:hypothetical protein